MNNRFKGLYDTEGTSFISDKVEPINYYEPATKTPRIQNHNYSINFDKTELYKEIETLQQELQRKDNIINELKKWLNYSIDKINQKLIEDKEIIVKDGMVMNMNDYQILRLKTFRTKMKEVLDKIKELENGNK